VGDSQGTTHEVPRGEVESLEPVAKSVMPDKLDEKLGKEGMEDLIHFLLSGAPSMPLEGRAVPYPARSRAEVLKVLAGAPEGEAQKGPLPILLTAGPKDHGPQEHDYPAWQKVWTRLMAMAPGVEVDTAWEWPKKEQLEKAKLLVLFQRGDWNGQRAEDLDAFLQRGGGVVLLHWAVDGRGNAEAFAERIGLAAHGGGIGFRHGPLTLNLEKDALSHPILRNMGDLKIHDESYWKLTGREERVQVLARSKEDGKDWPQVWTKQTGKGRVVGLIPGHYSWTFDDPLFRVLLLRSMAWAADEPVDRFNELVWPGARVGE
jgi:type 1 glutamine amidotransferase